MYFWDLLLVLTKKFLVDYPIRISTWKVISWNGVNLFSLSILSGDSLMEIPLKMCIPCSWQAYPLCREHSEFPLLNLQDDDYCILLFLNLKISYFIFDLPSKDVKISFATILTALKQNSHSVRFAFLAFKLMIFIYCELLQLKWSTHVYIKVDFWRCDRWKGMTTRWGSSMMTFIRFSIVVIRP
jgi:hypothetical protein